MKKLILLFAILAFAVCTYSAEYEVVFFKVGKKFNVNAPNVSQALEKECHSAFMAYDDKYAYVFAIVDTTKNITWLAITNLLLPLSPEDEAKYAAEIANARAEVDYINGVKPRPTFDMSGALE